MFVFTVQFCYKRLNVSIQIIRSVTIDQSILSELNSVTKVSYLRNCDSNYRYKNLIRLATIFIVSKKKFTNPKLHNDIKGL